MPQTQHSDSRFINTAYNVGAIFGWLLCWRAGGRRPRSQNRNGWLCPGYRGWWLGTTRDPKQDRDVLADVPLCWINDLLLDELHLHQERW